MSEAHTSSSSEGESYESENLEEFSLETRELATGPSTPPEEEETDAKTSGEESNTSPQKKSPGENVKATTTATSTSPEEKSATENATAETKPRYPWERFPRKTVSVSEIIQKYMDSRPAPAPAPTPERNPMLDSLLAGAPLPEPIAPIEDLIIDPEFFFLSRSQIHENIKYLNYYEKLNSGRLTTSAEYHIGDKLQKLKRKRPVCTSDTLTSEESPRKTRKGCDVDEHGISAHREPRIRPPEPEPEPPADPSEYVSLDGDDIPFPAHRINQLSLLSQDVMSFGRDVRSIGLASYPNLAPPSDNNPEPHAAKAGSDAAKAGSDAANAGPDPVRAGPSRPSELERLESEFRSLLLELNSDYEGQDVEAASNNFASVIVELGDLLNSVNNETFGMYLSSGLRVLRPPEGPLSLEELKIAIGQLWHIALHVSSCMLEINVALLGSVSHPPRKESSLQESLRDAEAEIKSLGFLIEILRHVTTMLMHAWRGHQLEIPAVRDLLFLRAVASRAQDLFLQLEDQCHFAKVDLSANAEEYYGGENEDDDDDSSD